MLSCLPTGAHYLPDVVISEVEDSEAREAAEGGGQGAVQALSLKHHRHHRGYVATGAASDIAARDTAPGAMWSGKRPGCSG